MTGHDFSEHDDAPVSTNAAGRKRAPRRWRVPQMQTEVEALPEIDDIRKEIETHLAADETIPPGLLRRYAALWHTTFQLDRHILSFAWRAGLYIPTDADWRNYWFAAPPPANRYRWQYPVTDQVVAGASITDGSLSAYASQLPGVEVVSPTHLSARATYRPTTSRTPKCRRGSPVSPNTTY